MAQGEVSMAAVSIRLPEHLKARLDRLAELTG
jgi:predicted transcriptional regulator